VYTAIAGTDMVAGTLSGSLPPNQSAQPAIPSGKPRSPSLPTKQNSAPVPNLTSYELPGQEPDRATRLISSRPQQGNRGCRARIRLQNSALGRLTPRIRGIKRMRGGGGGCSPPLCACFLWVASVAWFVRCGFRVRWQKNLGTGASTPTIAAGEVMTRLPLPAKNLAQFRRIFITSSPFSHLLCWDKICHSVARHDDLIHSYYSVLARLTRLISFLETQT
jgi:hypothetical protein